MGDDRIYLFHYYYTSIYFCYFLADMNYKDKLMRFGDNFALDTCQPDPCRNGGRCIDDGEKKFCQCVGHFTGKRNRLKY